MKKTCFKCNLVKPLEDFYKHPQMPDGRVNKCKDCNKIENKINWNKNREEKREYDFYRHRHSIQRIFNHKYSMIKTRCLKLRKDGRVYGSVFGKKFLSKEEWLKWCYDEKNYKNFINLYNEWVKSGFERKLTPSIDRINNKLSYTTKNMQWLTQSQNSSKKSK